MLLKAFVLAFLVFGVHSDVRFLQDPFAQTWEWNSPKIFNQEARVSDDSSVEREPLAPDYKDPSPAATEDKPVLNPKPHKPYNPEVIPGGVVDVDADGFAQLPQLPSLGISPHHPNFDFGDFGLGARPGGGGLFSFGGFFGSPTPQWWKGPNVCVEREESSDDENEEEDTEENKNQTERPVPNFFSTSIRLSNCQETDNKYECVTKINNHGVVKTFTVRYRCCYGFKRTRDSTGCTKQVDLKPILETIEDLGAKEFLSLIKSSGQEEKFASENLTVFTPTDEALSELNDKMSELNNVEVARRRRAVKNALSSNDLVLSHATPGFLDLTDLENEELIYSEWNNSTLRINVYPTHNFERMVTVNCARVKKANNLAKNGIVHLTEAVVAPATQSILDIIKEHPKLTSLKKILENTDIPSHMKESGHYTVFAPTDEAFNKLDESLKQKILKGEGCASSILKHHITSNTVCSSAIIGNATTHNVEGEVLNMERNVDNELKFEDKAKIIETDIMATNGVIHLIDEIIIPESALDINQVLTAQNFSKFQELVEKAGLTEEINTLENATLFVPSDKVFETEEGKKALEEEDTDKLKELVRYHLVQGQLQSCDMHNNVKIKTKDEGKELRVNLYSTLPLFSNIINRATVNCARIVGFDEKACGSVVHEVNRILVPPSQNILEVIENNDKYSTLRKILKDTDVEKLLQQQNRSITFLAPTDETFAALDEEDMKKLLEDKTKANLVLKNHVLTEVLCCAGVGPHSFGFNSLVPALSHQHYEIGRTGSQVRINRAVVTSCDNLATNGVVHTVNKVFIPQAHRVPTIGGGFFLFDL